jgi:hypothetical protein
MTRKHCWRGRHRWVKRETTEGDVYGECTHCGKRDWGHFATEADIGVPGKNSGGGAGIPGNAGSGFHF